MNIWIKVWTYNKINLSKNRKYEIKCISIIYRNKIAVTLKTENDIQKARRNEIQNK